MKSNFQKPSKLSAYLNAGLGVGCLAGQADAAVLVTFYGPGAQNSGSDPATPAGISIVAYSPGHYFPVDADNAIAAFSDVGLNYAYFTDGTDLGNFSNWGYGTYGYDGPVNGATFGSDQNYANISFNGDDGTYEALAQFFFDGAGGGYLVALARSDDDSALSISAGKAAIEAVPEPSGLALLALGAGGLHVRRRHQAA